MKEFKVGDKVKCMMFGEGEIGEIDRIRAYCVLVYFFACTIPKRYNKQGLFNDYANQTLFHLEDFPEIIYKPVIAKVTKYKVLIDASHTRTEDYFTSDRYFSSLDEARSILFGEKILQILESTAKDFWEEK